MYLIFAHRLVVLARAALVPLLANVLVHTLSVHAGGERHYFVNLDYFVVPVLYLVARRVAGRLVATVVAGMLLALLFAADVWGAINGHYFADPSMLFDLLPFVTAWPWRLLAPLMVGGLACAMLVVGLAAPSKPRWLDAAPTVLLLLVACATDAAWTHIQPTRQPQPNILSSGMATLLRPAINQLQNERSATVRVPTPMLANSFAVDYAPMARVPTNILSVGVESWGVSLDPETLARQRQILRRGLGGQYEMSFGAHHFHGSTLEGEVRELCGLQLNGIPRDATEREGLRHCLPRVLAAQGYVTSGWHGNSGSFYRRNDIYPAIGLQTVHAYETMRPRVATLCRLLFVGICDEDVLRMAAESFVSKQPAFVHVMTLDTHLPLPPPKRPCLRRHAAQLCSLEEGIDRTLESIVRAVSNAPVKPDLVVIFGDHAPPFLDALTRARFVSDQVPFVVLWRQGSTYGVQSLADTSGVRSANESKRLLTRR